MSNLLTSSYATIPSDIVSFSDSDPTSRRSCVCSETRSGAEGKELRHLLFWRRRCVRGRLPCRSGDCEHLGRSYVKQHKQPAFSLMTDLLENNLTPFSSDLLLPEQRIRDQHTGGRTVRWRWDRVPWPWVWDGHHPGGRKRRLGCLCCRKGGKAEGRRGQQGRPRGSDVISVRIRFLQFGHLFAGSNDCYVTSIMQSWPSLHLR